MSKLIPLTNDDGYAIVDNDDFAWLSQYRWANCDGYVVGFVDGRTSSMHRLIMGEPQGLEIDHINRNRRDNQRHNLQIVTHAVNTQNRKIQPRTYTYTDDDAELIKAINTVFDHTRQRLGFTSDKQLAQHMGISELTVWRARTGQLRRTDKVVLRTVVAYLTRTPKEKHIHFQTRLER